MSQSPQIAADLLTFEDFCEIVNDGKKADLLDGVIYIASTDSRRGNRIFRSKAIPGFWLEIDWLLADRLPNVYHCLQQVLGAA